MLPIQSTIAKQALKRKKPMAVRVVEISQQLQPVDDLEHYWSVRFFVTWNDVPIGSFDIANNHQPVSVEDLGNAIAEDPKLRSYQEHLLDHVPLEPLPEQFSVSIILPTCNRPEYLQNCLKNLQNQRTSRVVEIIVVDNCPGSDITSSVVAKFPNVKLINEWRPGASYARNTGISNSQGDIIVTIDDDVTPPPQWLENLISPLIHPNVMAVTGNVLPLELETPAQQLFEIYGIGGLCRGFSPFEMDGAQATKVRNAVPVWELGVSANAAFWAKIFQHPDIGLWEEKLGAGVPVGGGEDLFLFYQILKAGFTHAYAPQAYVWHRHRRDIADLRRQIYGYSQGYIAYHLMTFKQYGDWRALLAIATTPVYYYRRVKWQVTNKINYPILLLVQEVLGHFMAFWGLWKSYQHVCKHGKSQPAVSHLKVQNSCLKRL